VRPMRTQQQNLESLGAKDTDGPIATEDPKNRHGKRGHTFAPPYGPTASAADAMGVADVRLPAGRGGWGARPGRRGGRRLPSALRPLSRLTA